MLQHESQTYNNHSFRVKSLFTKMFFKPVSSFASYSANLRKTLIWAVPYDRASGVIRCRIRVNTADVYQHSCIQNNMSFLSLSHYALCRDTTGIPPSNKWPWRNITQPRLSFLSFLLPAHTANLSIFTGSFPDWWRPIPREGGRTNFKGCY